jgi:hypothetical protein
LVSHRVAVEVVVSERHKLAAVGGDLAGGDCFVLHCVEDVYLGCPAASRDRARMI